MFKPHKKAKRRRKPDAVAHIDAQGWREIERACDGGSDARPARSMADWVELGLVIVAVLWIGGILMR